VTSNLGTDLSTRELEVLRYVAKGYANAEVAGILWITTSTVGKHLEHIYDKLGVNSRTAAVARVFPPIGG
jgi:DNA-binding CsgD family transcriptional regulator